MPPKKTAGAPKAPKPAAKAAPKTASKTTAASKPAATKKSKVDEAKAEAAQAKLEALTINSQASGSGRKKRSAEPEAKEKPAKRAKVEPKAELKAAQKASKAAPKAAAKVKVEPELNQPPSQILDVYVFGTGENGELGLGNTIRNGKKPLNVSRPRLNDLISASTVGIVQIAVGGMHCVALSHDNRLYSWGVNDLGALGRDTSLTEAEKAAKAQKEAEDSDSDDEDEVDLHPKESTPTTIPSSLFPEGTKFAQVVACDSGSFALTTTGHVFGWGTFSGADGVIGFSKEGTLAAAKADKKDIKKTPTLIPDLKKIKKLATGQNHILALDHDGNVYAWGCGEQNQIGRRLVVGRRANGLTPSQFGLPKRKVVDIAAGSYHSFAIDEAGKVYTWGLNNFGQGGISNGAGEDSALIEYPTVVSQLEDYKIKEIEGGTHHSIASTEDNEILVWGRCDDSQVGVPLDTLPKDDLVFNEAGKPRILSKPIVVPGVKAIHVSAGIDNCLVISTQGQAYSWGFSSNYRTGLGTQDSIEKPTKIENTALVGKKLSFAGCGGQYSVLAGPAHLTNGH